MSLPQTPDATNLAALFEQRAFDAGIALTPRRIEHCLDAFEWGNWCERRQEFYSPPSMVALESLESWISFWQRSFGRKPAQSQELLDKLACACLPDHLKPHAAAGICSGIFASCHGLDRDAGEGAARALRRMLAFSDCRAPSRPICSLIISCVGVLAKTQDRLGFDAFSAAFASEFRPQELCGHPIGSVVEKLALLGQSARDLPGNASILWI